MSAPLRAALSPCTVFGMGYRTTAQMDVLNEAIAITTNGADESLVYATVSVAQSPGFERNAVVVRTGAGDAQAMLDQNGNGMMRDDVARALSAALGLHYARKDGVIVGDRLADVVAMERVRAYANRCGIMRVEPSTEGLRKAIEGDGE